MKLKKTLSAFLAVALLLIPLTISAGAASAVPTATPIRINGQTVQFDAYNIGGNNYVKLRDLAYALTGTSVQFNVAWNNGIVLTSDTAYVPVGGEMTSKGTGAKSAVTTACTIVKDGVRIPLAAYNIEKNNYFKIRDIGQIFDFSVDYDTTAKCVQIDTSKPYTMPASTIAVPTINSYYLLLIGQAKADIDRKLTITGYGDNSTVIYNDMVLLAFNTGSTGNKPVDTSRCSTVMGALSSFVSGSYSSLTRNQLCALFGSSPNPEYIEGEDTYKLAFSWGGLYFLVDCDANGTASSSSYVFAQFPNSTAFQADTSSSSALGDWEYIGETGCGYTEDGAEYRTGQNVHLTINSLTPTAMTFEMGMESFYVTSWKSDGVEGTLYSKDGVHYSTGGLTDNWSNTVTVDITLQGSTVVMKVDTIKCDSMADFAAQFEYTLAR